MKRTRPLLLLGMGLALAATAVPAMAYPVTHYGVTDGQATAAGDIVWYNRSAYVHGIGTSARTQPGWVRFDFAAGNLGIIASVKEVIDVAAPYCFTVAGAPAGGFTEAFISIGYTDTATWKDVETGSTVSWPMGQTLPDSPVGVTVCPAS